MSRTIEITVPQKMASKVINSIQDHSGVVGISLQKDVSIKPVGSIISVTVTNKSHPDLVKTLADQKIGITTGTTLVTSEPLSVSSSSYKSQITDDASDAIWEEMDQTIAKESNSTGNMLGMMFLSGFIAAFGIATNAVHLVIGAMVIAPGFEPIIRIGLGMVVKSSSAMRRGLLDSFKGYLSLVVGATLATLIMPFVGVSQTGLSSSYLAESSLLMYWTSITPTLILVTLAAGAAGTILIASNRSVLTAGVMIALALVPAATLIGMGVSRLDLPTIATGASSLLLQFFTLFIVSWAIFAWKKSKLYQREMLS